MRYSHRMKVRCSVLSEGKSGRCWYISRFGNCWRKRTRVLQRVWSSWMYQYQGIFWKASITAVGPLFPWFVRIRKFWLLTDSNSKKGSTIYSNQICPDSQLNHYILQYHHVCHLRINVFPYLRPRHTIERRHKSTIRRCTIPSGLSRYSLPTLSSADSHIGQTISVFCRSSCCQFTVCADTFYQ